MDECKSCGKDMDREGTHWDGCHANHPECAAFKAGREAGMREAAALLRRSEDRLIGGIRRVAAADRHTAYVLHNHADAILSAIEGAK